MVHTDPDHDLQLDFGDAPIGLAVVGTDGRFLRVNPELCYMLGRGRPELEGQTFASITFGGDRESSLAMKAMLLAGGAERGEFDKSYIRPDGSVVHAVITVRLVRDGDGHPSHFVTVVRDVTDEADGRFCA